MSKAFEPVQVGRWELPQRFVMAPMTRNRTPTTVPTELNARYYGQRAGAGLLITEGTQPSAVGQAYLATPGIHSDAQREGWRPVADAVHDGGGRLFVQLMHGGRISHPDNKDGLETVAPSAIRASGEIVTPSGRQPYPTPRALTTEEATDVIAEYVGAAENAISAGIDGVEIHAANGYLPHQFLAPSSNRRSDAYGGDPVKRARFVVELTRAVAAAIGADRTGIRLSPAFNIQDVIEDDETATRATYDALLAGIDGLGLAYLHVLGDPADRLIAHLREAFSGTFILNTGFAEMTSLDDVERLLDAGGADVIAVGRPFLSNPDLVERWRLGAALNEHDPETHYTGGERGYTDYPRRASGA